MVIIDVAQHIQEKSNVKLWTTFLIEQGTSITLDVKPIFVSNYIVYWNLCFVEGYKTFYRSILEKAIIYNFKQSQILLNALLKLPFNKLSSKICLLTFYFCCVHWNSFNNFDKLK